MVEWIKYALHMRKGDHRAGEVPSVSHRPSVDSWFSVPFSSVYSVFQTNLQAGHNDSLLYPGILEG